MQSSHEQRALQHVPMERKNTIPPHTSFLLAAFLLPPFADSIPMVALLLTRLSHPVDVRGRGRDIELPLALLFAPPGAPHKSTPPADVTNSAADSDSPSRSRRAATTSCALSIVCTGTNATEDSVETAAPPGSGARLG